MWLFHMVIISSITAIGLAHVHYAASWARVGRATLVSSLSPWLAPTHNHAKHPRLVSSAPLTRGGFLATSGLRCATPTSIGPRPSATAGLMPRPAAAACCRVARRLHPCRGPFALGVRVAQPGRGPRKIEAI